MEGLMPSISRKVMIGSALTAGALATFAKLGMQPESQLFGRTLVAGNTPDELARAMRYLKT